MTTIELGPNVRLQKVGDFSRAVMDPEMKPPIEVTSKFPPKAENFKCGPEGTWYATVEELVLVKEGRAKVKRPRHRIHWLTADEELRVVKDLPVFLGIAFDRTVALLTADRGALLQLSLEERSISPLAIEGYTFTDEARLWEIFLLEGERVILREALTKTAVLAKQTERGLVHLTNFAFPGTFTVMNKRYLVGGAKSVTAIDLATDTPREMGTTTEVGVGMIWGFGSNVRIYSNPAGAWQIVTS